MARKRNRSKKPAGYTYSKPGSGSGRSSVGNFSSIERSRSIGNAHRKLVGLTNPFSDASRGSRIPDDDSAPSIPVTMKEAISFNPTAGPSGNQIAIAVIGSVTEAWQSCTTFTTGGSDTICTTWNPRQPLKDLSILNGQAQQWRLVSMGVRFYSSAPPTAQGGVVRVITSPSIPPDGIDLAGGMFQSVDNFPISQSDVHVVLRPQGTTWKEYRPINEFADYDKVYFLVQGADPLYKVHVEITMNLEILPLVNSLTGAIAKPGEDSHPAVLQAASRVHARHNGIHSSRPSVFATLGNLAKNALADVASSAIPFIGNAVGNLLRGNRQQPLPRIMNYPIEEVN